AEIWNERMMPRRATSAGRSRVMSVPLKRMVPAVGGRNLVSRLKKVVLPAPLGPISAWMAPRRTRRFTLSTATKPLNSLVRPRVSRMVSPVIESRECAPRGPSSRVAAPWKFVTHANPRVPGGQGVARCIMRPGIRHGPAMNDRSLEPPLLRADEAGVATLTLNRGRQYNALSGALLAALHAG